MVADHGDACHNGQVVLGHATILREHGPCKIYPSNMEKCCHTVAPGRHRRRDRAVKITSPSVNDNQEWYSSAAASTTTSGTSRSRIQVDHRTLAGLGTLWGEYARIMSVAGPGEQLRARRVLRG